MQDTSLITLGLWPIAGITTVGVDAAEARETIVAAIESGVCRFDTAFSYGYDGESDRILSEFACASRDSIHITGKVGQRWSRDAATGQQKRIVDGTPDTLTRDAEDSLKRLGIERYDCLMLHSPDPTVDLRRSAEAIDSLRRRGICRDMGVCNVTLDQRRQFADAAPCDVIQCPLNMLQQDSLQDLIPDCESTRCEVLVFWTLMKGLLTGKIARDHVFDKRDVRPSYAVFQGDARKRAHFVIDALAEMGRETNRTIAQLAVGWALSQDGVTGALVGARRPNQIRETARATPLSESDLRKVNEILTDSSDHVS